MLKQQKELEIELTKLEVDGGNEMQDKYVLNCPFCGGTEVIESWQGGYGAVTAVSNKWGGAGLYHSICRNCGSVVRSYVKEPEKLLKKKDRRQFINYQSYGEIESN